MWLRRWLWTFNKGPCSKSYQTDSFSSFLTMICCSLVEKEKSNPFFSDIDHRVYFFIAKIVRVWCVPLTLCTDIHVHTFVTKHIPGSCHKNWAFASVSSSWKVVCSLKNAHKSWPIACCACFRLCISKFKITYVIIKTFNVDGNKKVHSNVIAVLSCRQMTGYTWNTNIVRTVVPQK